MNDSHERDEELTEEHSSISKPRSYPGTGSRFHQLYQPPQAKVCYFYKDNDQTFRGLKLTVNKKYYNNVEVLKHELTKKVPGLPFGVRSIFTPTGRHSVASVDSLEHEGHYVCSTYTKRAKGVDILRLREVKPWHGGRAPSGRRRYNATLRDPTDIQSLESPRRLRRAWEPQRDNSSGPFPSRPKKVTLIDMERPNMRHVLLLNRKTAQSFEQVLEDISQMFQMPCRKLYTIDGRPVRSLSAILHGPDVYMVTNGEHFKPNTSMSDPPPQRKRAIRGGRTNVSDRLREKRERLSKTRGKWTVWVTTNELPSAGTQAQVSITVYGHKGNSGPIPLGYADGQTFQAGNIDEFESQTDVSNDEPVPTIAMKKMISVGNIGEIYKIRIGHDNTGEFPGWFLDEVRMQDVHTEEELIFKCQRWLSRDEEDGEICRELPAVRDKEPILPILVYEVTTVTGDLWNAGTSANVYITLYGERGDTGVRQLYKPNRDKFKKGQTDVFTVEAVSLGQLRRAIIGHDGANAGEGWYLEKLVVRALDSAQNKQPLEWTFYCKKWLDVGEDDGKIVRELKPYNTYNQDVIEKQVFDYERWKYGPDCVVMIYSKATQKPVRIKPDSSVDCAGEYNDRLAQFQVIPRNGPIRIFRSIANNKYHLAIDNGKTIGKGKGGSYCEFRVRTQEDRSVILESVKYFGQQLTVHPNGKMGDPRAQSGDPTKQFFVYCKGVTRDGGVLILCTSLSQTMRINNDSTLYATGRRDKLAHFKIHKVREGGIRMFESTVFPGQYIRLREGQVDCKGVGDQHCEFKVEKIRDQGYITIESSSNRGLFLGMTPEGKIRPVVNTGDKNVRFYPEVVEFGRRKKRTLTPPAESPELPLPSRPAKVQRQRKPKSPSPPPPHERTPTPIFKEEEQKEKSIFAEGDWKVFVTTEETNDGGDVTMVVYGDKGNSGPIVLGKATDSSLFAAGNLDEFKVNLSKVGKIYKIRMELNPSNIRKEPSWKLKEVKMKDMTTNETLKFKFNRWLSKNHDDGSMMRELGAVRPKQKVPKLMTYQVHVYTGNEDGADTDANVYMNLFGELGDTGRRLLHRSDQKTLFQEGQVDKFEIEAVDLGKLKRCVIGHDGEGAGEGWFCEQVIVRESEDADKEYVFPCRRWLDTSIDDHKIERVLKLKGETLNRTEKKQEYRPIPVASNKEEAAQEEEEKPKPGDWRVWVVTGREDNMGTTNEVSLVAYGDEGVSDTVVLGSGRDGTYFQKGNNDDFKINLGTDLGKLYKIRIGHDDAEPESGWFLEKVKMKNLMTDDLLTFKVNRWLSRSKEDSDVWRELPAVWPGEDPLPVLTYTVEVYTGSKPGADTEANVYIELHGKRGDSGRRILYHSKNNEVKFQEGQVDVFSLEAVDLDGIEKVIIGHDETSKGAGWFCDKVIVKHGEDEEASIFYFPCGKWLDKGLEDGKIERELKPAEPPKQSKGEYQVWISTHEDSRPCNGSAAVLTVYGEKGKSHDMELYVDKQELFEPGSVDEFQISVGDIGKPYKIRIGRQDKDRWEGWFLDEVKMADKDTGEEYVFEFDRWLDRRLDDCDIVRERPVMENEKPVLPMRHYEVSVYTGDRWAADTDADVYITLYGSKGDFGKRWLYSSKDNARQDMFQRGQVDTFVFEAVSLQDLRKLVIGHNGQGHGAGWFLDKVIVKEAEGENSDKEFIFPCNRWLDDQEDDGKTERELKLLETTTTGSTYRPMKKGAKTQGQWKVVVKTSDLHNAGTHAQVYLTAYGDKGNSGREPLGRGGAESDDFEKGKESQFKINVGDIGTIYKIRIEHDNTGNFPAWHVEQITMTDEHTAEELKFYVYRWLAVDEEDGSLCRELPVVRPGQPTPPVLRYYVAVYTGNLREAGTSADVFINVYGEHGDCGRRQLAESKLHSTKWLQGQIDVFIIEAVQLGKLHKIALEHNGTDKESAWFVEKVIVKEGIESHMEYLFRINDWIEPHHPNEKNQQPRFIPLAAEQPYTPLPEEDQKLLQGDRPASNGIWIIWTLTGEDQYDSVEASVSLEICGTNGCSNPIPLRKDKDDITYVFETGALDQFQGRASDIGKVLKVRLRMAVKGDNPPEWFLKKLKLKDYTTKEEFHFNYNGWLKKSEEIPQEEEVILEMAAIRPDLAPLEDLNYEVSITTGDLPRADTKAQVYCMLSGVWGDTGIRPLYKSNNEQMFLRAQTDVFKLPAVEVGKLSKIIIGHDTIGKGKGWYCDKVKVKTSPEAESEIIFPCNRWLDTGLEDRQIRRELLPLTEVPVASEDDDNKPPSNGDFKVGIKLADTQSSPSGNSNNSNNNNNQVLDYDLMNANNNNVGNSDDSESLIPPKGVITLTIYGEKGKSEPFELDPTLDDLSVHAGDIGSVYKIRVTSGQEMGPETQWPIQEISLQDADTKEKLIFDFSPWVGEVGGDTSKELPAVKPNSNVPKLIKYQISVFTDKDSPVPKQQKSQPDKTGAKERRQPGQGPTPRGQQRNQRPSDSKARAGGKQNAATKDNTNKPVEPDVYINLMGSLGDSGVRHLKINSDNSIKFQPDKVDVFTVEAVDLGDVDKIHVIKRPGVSWKLSKVVIKSGPYAPRESIFVCDKLFEEKAQDDPEEDIEIPLSSTQKSNTAVPLEECPDLPQSNGNWKVQTQTGNDQQMAINSPVYVILCGEKGETRPVTLRTSDTDGESPRQKRRQPSKATMPFQPGKRDEFKIHVNDDIGEVIKIRLGFEDESTKSRWFVEEVTFEDEDTHDEFTVEIHDWIEVNEEDEPWKEYPVVWPGLELLQSTKYQVDVYTGDHHKAGTNANVYIILAGENGNSGKRMLRKSLNNFNKFEQGQMDRFEFECVHLGALHTVTVGHDGYGAGSGWLLDKVVVTEAPETETERIYEFECDKWLDEGEDDGAIERVLKVSESPIQSKQGSKWNITAVTGKHKQASPGCQAVLVIYGDKGKSDDIQLGEDPQKAFKPGKSDTAEVLVPQDLGDVYKVRVGFSDDDQQRHPSWLLEKINLQNLKTGKEYDFVYNDWVKCTPEHDGWTEIPVQDGTEPNLPVNTYTLDVYTGDQRHAGTDATVYVVLYGERGDTGRRKLLNSNNKDKFREGQVDQFELQAVDLGQLTKVTVGHDGKGRGAGWFLEKLVISDPTDQDKMTVFECNRWLDEGEDDGAIERDLEPKKGNPWTVTVTTVKHKNAAPGAQVVMVIYGDKDKSEEMPLGNDPKNNFKPGATETFNILVPQDIGHPFKIRVGYDEESYKDKPFWYLDKIILEDEENKETYEFLYHNWVTVTDEEDGWTEIPVQDPDENNILPVHVYNVEVYTGRVRNAGTDANVYMIMYGERGDTGKRKLLKSNNKDKFKEGQVDKFEIRAVHLGDIKRITIGHDGKGVGAGWFLDKIVVIDPVDPEESTTFECNRWLDEGEDDHKTERDLEPKKGNPWLVTVTTGKHKNASPGAQILMVMYGDQGKSEEIAICEDPWKCLQPKKKEELEVLVPQTVGQLYKVRLGYADDDQEEKPSWFMEKMTLEDLTNGNTYDFVYNDWIAVTDDHDGWTELPVITEEKKNQLPVQTYQIEVHTGDKPHAGTNATVYIMLHGELGDTGKRKLLKSNNVNTFEEGQVDKFELQAVDLGDLHKVTVGHNGKGPGSGWYLDSVVITSSTGEKGPWTFRCDRWLDEGEDDGAIERDLELSKGSPWKVRVTTVKHKNASPGAQAVMVIYGEKDKSEEIPIGDDPNKCLQPGKTEEYDIILPDVGDVYKVRVGFSEEDYKKKPFWYLDKIQLRDQTTEKTYEFWYNDWVAVKDDQDGWIELPIQEHEDIMLPVRTYNVELFTSNIKGASTKANVYIILYGDRGDTGKRKMLKSNNKEKFKEGQVDKFELQAVDLGDIYKITVGHDGKDPKAGWHLEKAIITLPEEDKVWQFDCNRWLDAGEDDNAIERDLELPKAKPWKALVTTGKHKQASPKCQVVMVLYGDGGKTEEFPLNNDPLRDLQPGKTEEFNIMVPNHIGDLYKIRLGFTEEAQSNEPSWFLDKIILNDPEEERNYEFWYNNWIKVTEEHDGWTEIPVQENEDIMLPVHTYTIDVYTGDEKYAGTDANVYLILYGERGDTGKRKLLKSNNKSKFESGQVDRFELQAVDLGDIHKVTVGHDGTGAGAGWFLEKIVIYNPVDEEQTTVFKCNRWLDEGEDDGLIERDLIVENEIPWKVYTITGKDKKAAPKAQIIMVIYGEKDKTEEIPLGDSSKDYFKPGATDEFDIMVPPSIGEPYKVRLGFAEEDQSQECSWLLDEIILEDQTAKKKYQFLYGDWVKVTDEQDGWTEIPRQENTDIMLPVRTYKIEVYTGERDHAGTNANVYIIIHGERGDTGKRKLKHSNNMNKFEEGQCDIFEIKAVDLGELKKVTIGHDGRGLGSGWFLDKIHVVEEREENNVTIFKCGQWLDEDEGDGLTERDLEPVKDDFTWKVWTVTGSDANAKEKSTVDKKSKNKKSKKQNRKDANYIKSEPPSGQVVIVVYGTKGKTDEIALVNERDDNFKEGQTDEFDITISQNLGQVYKVRVGYGDDSSRDESWFLHTLILSCLKDNKEYTFELKDHLIKNDEMDGWREIPVKPQTDAEDDIQQDALQAYMYQVDVYTGREKYAGTDANVYLTIYGERGDTGKRKLLKSDNENKFEEAQKDRFEIQAVDLGELKKIVIGHDGRGAGSGWFLEKVVVHNPKDDTKQWDFPCNKWLDEDQDDGLTERELLVDKTTEDGEWRVFITTSDITNSGTDSQVYLTVFGDKGNSGQLPLGEPGSDFFQSGATDEFDIFLDPEAIGNIWKIRLEHNNRYEGCGWHVEKVVLENKKTGESLTFPINRWMDEDEDDGDIVREVAVERPGEKPMPVTKYIVQTVTGSEFGAGTDAKVYITLYGKNGDSGRRRLNISNNRNKFEKGQTDTFSLEAIGLGPLEKVVIGHDQQGPGSGWYLDKVIIKESEDGPEMVFPCNRWLDIDEDDHKTERELYLDGKSPNGNDDEENEADSDTKEEDD